MWCTTRFDSRSYDVFCFKQHKRDRKPLYLFRHKSSFRYNRLQDFNRWDQGQTTWFHFHLLEKIPPKNYLIRICNLWYTIRFNFRSYVISHLYAFHIYLVLLHPHHRSKFPWNLLIIKTAVLNCLVMWNVGRCISLNLLNPKQHPSQLHTVWSCFLQIRTILREKLMLSHSDLDEVYTFVFLRFNYYNSSLV